MKTFRWFVIAFATLFIASCGENSSTYEVTVDNTTIGGKLSNYFSLVDKTYKYQLGVIDEIYVELECITPLPEDLKAYIGVEILNEDGTVISAGKPDAWSFNDYDVLRQATPGQIVTIKIENHENLGDEKPAKIRLSSIVEEDTGENKSSSNSDAENSSDDNSFSDDSNEDSMSNSSDSEDWDALLDSYEEYVDEYISYVKKAAQGDMDALTEYPSMLKKAEEFSKKMQGAKGSMSASQWARYNEITMKMAKVAQEM